MGDKGWKNTGQLPQRMKEELHQEEAPKRRKSVTVQVASDEKPVLTKKAWRAARKRFPKQPNS